MNTEALANNWALIAAIVPALIALVLILRYLVSRTAGGKLAEVFKNHRAAERELADARRMRVKAAARVEKLTAKAQNIPPRTLQEARDAAEDAGSLEKIAHDRVLVAANHVRRVIVEEFPPASQERLRIKYLPGESGAGQP